MAKLKGWIIGLTLAGAAGAGTYYMYRTDEGFQHFVDHLIPSESVHTDTIYYESQQVIPVVQSKVPKKLKPGIFDKVDNYARKTPKQYEKDLSTLAGYLVAGGSNELEKVRSIFTWVATNVRYDDAAFNTGVYPDYTPESVIKTKKAVCEGYSILFEALCKAAGFQAMKIQGYAKGYGYVQGDKFQKTDHAWNAVKIGGTWKLFDVTWASGSGTKVNGKLVSTKKFDPGWFDVHPKAFIFTHLPEDPSWQFIGKQITLSAYEAMPYVDNSFFDLGFNPQIALTEALAGNLKSFPDCYPSDFPHKAIQLPYTGILWQGQMIKYVIESEYADDIVLIESGTWHNFKKENNTFSLLHIPKSSELQIAVRINSFDKNYSTILSYQVKKKGGA